MRMIGAGCRWPGEYLESAPKFFGEHATGARAAEQQYVTANIWKDEENHDG
jgi:hypothetical protein